MAENSGFFDAHLVNGEYDRVYLAESFAKYFASFIGNGIFGGKSNELMVKQKTAADMSVRVLSGQGWINGYWYENDNELSLAIDIADGVLNRIDIIVLRWDNSERVIRLAVKKGTSATSPSAPTIQRGADLYELKLAQVYIKAGATKITQADITDTRLNNEVCGFVHGVIDQIDTTEFGKQIDSFIENFEASNIDKMQAIFDRINSLINEDMATKLTLDVDNLKSLFIESGPNKGCFYRVASTGENEWINPPNKVGISYRTTERWNGKVVYRELFYIGALPNKNLMSFNVNTRFDRITSISGFAINNDNNKNYPFPIIFNGLTPAAVISYAENDGGEGSTIVIQTNKDISNLVGYIIIKYVKE